MLDDISPEGSQQVISSLKYPHQGPKPTIRNRQLQIFLNMPNDNVTLKEDLAISVRVSKDSLSVQSHALIDITNLTNSMRHYLMSNFSAYDRRVREKGLKPEYFINVEVSAGYIAPGASWNPNRVFTEADLNHPVEIPNYSDISTMAPIYHGQIVMCSLLAAPPDITIRMECFTNQLNKATDVVNNSPDGMTFKQYVYWAGKAMGFDEGHIYCKTDIDAQKIKNFGRRNNVAEQLVYYIEHIDWPNIAAFIDDNLFIVKNRRDVMNPGDMLKINEFVGIPTWDEWGVQFTTLFTPLIKLGGGVTLESKINPGINGDYVIGRLEYELHSRDTPFYVHALALPPP
jgi:hypothetical protein